MQLKKQRLSQPIQFKKAKYLLLRYKAFSLMFAF